MVPAHYLLRRHHYDRYGGNCSVVRPVDHTAQEDSKSGAAGINGGGGGGDVRDEAWLQLGLGSFSSAAETSLVGISPADPGSSRRKEEASTELDLLISYRSHSINPRPIVIGNNATTVRSINPTVAMVPSYLLPPTTAGLSSRHYPPNGTWNDYTAHAPPLHYLISSGSTAARDQGSRRPVPSSELMRLVSPPQKRPHSGAIWFVLQAAHHQQNEPFLPQIPKSYLRIKDGKMTVGLLMKYLVNKLGLDDESEVEIACRGQQLDPYLTLQNVRDDIWCPRDDDDVVAATLLSDSPINHVMTLNYARTTAQINHLQLSPIILKKNLGPRD